MNISTVIKINYFLANVKILKLNYLLSYIFTDWQSLMEQTYCEDT